MKLASSDRGLVHSRRRGAAASFLTYGSAGMQSFGRAVLRNCVPRQAGVLQQQQHYLTQLGVGWGGRTSAAAAGHAARNVRRAAVEAAAPTSQGAAQDAAAAAAAAAAAGDSAMASANGSGAGQASTAYPFAEIEARWQQHWEEQQTFRTPMEVCVCVCVCVCGNWVQCRMCRPTSECCVSAG
jgi:pimeloyl-ACP methyl ester carboxylesterase